MMNNYKSKVREWCNEILEAEYMEERLDRVVAAAKLLCDMSHDEAFRAISIYLTYTADYMRDNAVISLPPDDSVDGVPHAVQR